MEENSAQLAELHLMTAEMLTATRSLAPTLAALDGRLAKTEMALAVITTRIEPKLEDVDKHELRIKSLEDDRTKIKAWAALIAFLGTISAFLVGKFWPK